MTQVRHIGHGRIERRPADQSLATEGIDSQYLTVGLDLHDRVGAVIQKILAFAGRTILEDSSSGDVIARPHRRAERCQVSIAIERGVGTMVDRRVTVRSVSKCPVRRLVAQVKGLRPS